MSRLPACPQCGLDNTYPDGAQLACPDCGHEWTAGDGSQGEPAMVVRDCNGNVLVQGDTVVVIKDLKVRGSPVALKQGAVIRNIRLVEDDPEHIEGHSDRIRDLVLKTCFLRKA